MGKKPEDDDICWPRINQISFTCREVAGCVLVRKMLPYVRDLCWRKLVHQILFLSFPAAGCLDTIRHEDKQRWRRNSTSWTGTGVLPRASFEETEMNEIVYLFCSVHMQAWNLRCSINMHQMIDKYLIEEQDQSNIKCNAVRKDDWPKARSPSTDMAEWSDSVCGMRGEWVVGGTGLGMDVEENNSEMIRSYPWVMLWMTIKCFSWRKSARVHIILTCSITNLRICPLLKPDTCRQISTMMSYCCTCIKMHTFCCPYEEETHTCFINRIIWS